MKLKGVIAIVLMLVMCFTLCACGGGNKSVNAEAKYASAKAKAIEEQAEKEYAIRMDQARYAAEGIYAETAERITGVVDTAVNNNMDRIYNLLDEFIYSKTLPGRVNAFVNNCKAVAQKVKEAPAKAAAKVKAVITEKLNAKKAPVEAAE